MPAPKLPSDDPDLVDRMFAYMLEVLPELAGRTEDVKRVIREEFGGAEHWVRSHRSAKRAQTAVDVLRYFNGANASEVARLLKISRGSVYRHLKQAGRAKA
jgi:Mor family transcriptional regulator